LDGKCLCYSANSRLSKLKNFLFPLKEKVRKTIKRCRDNFSAVLSHYGCLAESLEQNLKIWLWIFFKESSNFAQKTQPSFSLLSILQKSYYMMGKSGLTVFYKLEST